VDDFILLVSNSSRSKRSWRFIGFCVAGASATVLGLAALANVRNLALFLVLVIFHNRSRESDGMEASPCLLEAENLVIKPNLFEVMRVEIIFSEVRSFLPTGYALCFQKCV
jgi:hypothetical protein